jgi:putative aldouronate transport system permease protein
MKNVKKVKRMTIGLIGRSHQPKDSNDLMKRVWKHKELYLILMPGLIYYIVYRYVPMYGAIISFKDFNVGKGIIDSPWADPWFKHFQYFFRSPYSWRLIRNTFLISFYRLLWGMPPGIILALLLNEVRHIGYKRMIQTLSYLPYFLSWVIIYGIVIAFFSESSGLINKVTYTLFEFRKGYLISNEWFRILLVSTGIWKNLGWSAIIYLAAISGLDLCMYESARIDGASKLQMMWHITLPGIRNVIMLLLILRLGNIMNAGFEQVFVMYNVHVYETGDILDTWVFRTGLEQWNFSLSSAVGLFKSFIGMILIISTNQIAKKWDSAVW